MAVTMALIILAVLPSFAKEESHGAWDLADEIKKASTVTSLNSFLTSSIISAYNRRLDFAAPGYGQSSQGVVTPLLLTIEEAS